MILVIDVGNSRIKWGFAEHGEIIAHGEDVHPSRLSAFAAEHWEKQGKPNRIIVSNVSKQSLGDRIKQWAQRQWGIEPVVVVSLRQYADVTNAYADSGQLGSDRWAALIAVRKMTKESSLIVDAGSAITIDVIDGSGAHLGGLIMPGIEMMRAALVNKTERIKLTPDISQTAPVLLARDTRSAVVGGTLYAAVATIDRVTNDVIREVGRCQCFITGGDSLLLKNLLSLEYQHRPNLVLEGLAALAMGEV